MGASGKPWAFQYWYLHEDEAPDMMTFGGKSGISGFYSKQEFKLLNLKSNIDMTKLLNYGLMWKIM